MGLDVASDVKNRIRVALAVPGHPDREAALKKATFNRIRHGEVLAAPHVPQRQVHYIESGRVRLVLHGPRGNDRIVSLLGPGMMIGEAYMQMVVPSTSAYSFGMVETYSWDVETALSLVESNPSFAFHVIQSLSMKSKMFVAQIEALSFFSAAERVARTFRNLAEIYGEPTRHGLRIRLRVTQEDIGEMANASRVTVSKVVSRLRQKDLITKQRGWYFVGDPDRVVNVIQESQHIA